jgi:hypothetical protein
LYALNYTVPRKHLHLFGAPPSKHAKSYQLPKRPVGATAADDDFSSPFPVPGGPWSDADVFKETLAQHGGAAIGGQLYSDKVSDETILAYLHHPEITHRFDAMGVMLKLKKDAVLLDLLRSKDARLRHIGIMAVHELLGTWRGSSDEQKRRVTPEMLVAVDIIIRNPEESGFVRQWAFGLLKHADLERLPTFRPLLAEVIEKGPARGSAINASMAFLVDSESYQVIFPAMMKTISGATSFPLAVASPSTIGKVLEKASPAIQAYGLNQLKGVMAQLPKQLVSDDTGIYVIPDGAIAKRKALGQSLAFSPEGKEFMKRIPKTTLKSYISGKDSDMFTFDGKFQNDKKYVGSWLWAVWPNPKHPGEIDAKIQDWIKKRKGNVVPTDIKDTVDLRADGTVQSKGFYGGKHKGDYFWTGETIFGINTGEACTMEIRQFERHDFLIIESGNFAPVIPKEGEVETTAVSPDYHCGYNVYVRKR